MAHNAAVLAEIEERRSKLIKLRRKRTPYDSREILDLGYESSAAARKDFYRAVTARRQATAAEVADYREEQNQIYESLLDTYLPLATDDVQPDYKAADIVLKTLERQAKTNGWEEALKAELSGPNGGPMRVSTATIAELNTLINAAGDPDDEDDVPGDEPEDGDVDDDGDHT